MKVFANVDRDAQDLFSWDPSNEVGKRLAGSPRKWEKCFVLMESTSSLG